MPPQDVTIPRLIDMSKYNHKTCGDIFHLIFAGAARRAGPDSMLILCLSVCLCVYLR